MVSLPAVSLPARGVDRHHDDRVDERAGFVEVLRFWHTSRSKAPKL
ncbi:MAG: hypothetical protein IT380_19855 [Myxococcales bacterium]|nr:hypothetical protein [Myxococcales bacterium]